MNYVTIERKNLNRVFKEFSKDNYKTLISKFLKSKDVDIVSKNEVGIYEVKFRDFMDEMALLGLWIPEESEEMDIDLTVGVTEKEIMELNGYSTIEETRDRIKEMLKLNLLNKIGEDLYSSF